MVGVSRTQFGKEHGLSASTSYEEFKAKVSVRDYEDLRPYIDKIVKKGESDVLWPGKPRYFAKTSGTTSGVKYIPLTKESIPNHFGTARNALFLYMVRTGNYRFFDGKLIFLSGSPVLDTSMPIPTGRLSGISNHLIPKWLKTNQLPSYTTNCIEEWDEKVDAIVEETHRADLRLISGIPPWVQMYYERLLAKTGKKNIKEVFPNFSVFVYGGVNFEPYRARLEELMGGRIDSVETYPASEGFIAFQDEYPHKGLLLNVNSGIFFEFIPTDEYGKPDAIRLPLSEVKMGVNYALVLSNNAGLWAYDIGDTVEFVSLKPYRIQVTGRVKHFISAFGEHVIGKEVEAAMTTACSEFGAKVTEFTVAPQVTPSDGRKPHHEWLVEFSESPRDINAFVARLDELMCQQNIYYADLIEGSILETLRVTMLKEGAFHDYMKSIGKLGGQNKVPRLSNDRKLADALVK